MNKVGVVGALACAMLMGCSAQNGAPGAAGATGQKGDTGAVGPSGPQGVQGPQGIQGPQGVAGPSGPQGAQGLQGLTGLQGAKGMVWRGSWSALDTYFPDDAVEHGGSAYVAIATSSGLAPPSTDWQLLAARGLDGPAGATGPAGPVGSTGAAGTPGLDGQSVATASIGPGHPVCTYGGTLVQSASGDSYVCHGAPGTNGSAGQSVSAVNLLPGADPACPAGGTRFTTGSTVTYACNATEAGPCPLGRMLCGGVCTDVASDPANCGACSNACDSQACSSGSCAKLVFITSQTYTGDLGGVAGASAKCQALASAAGLHGIYAAWLSDSLGNMPATSFKRSTAPYVQRNGAIVAANWSSFVASFPFIILDELGRTAPANAWTGTNRYGSAISPNCGNWTGGGSGITGAIATQSQAWTEYLADTCTNLRTLYCFEQ